jgi:hypothetical protein
MKTAKTKGKAGITEIKLTILLIFLTIPVLNMSFRNVTITYCNSGTGESHPINYIVEQPEYSGINENSVPESVTFFLSNKLYTPVTHIKAKGIYILMSELPNPEGIYDVKSLSP